MNILIADDERTCLLSLRDGLLQDDPAYRIRTATNGAEALESLGQEPFDLLITDLKMPVMDGFQLLLKVRETHPRLPVVVMTAFGTPEIEEELNRDHTLIYLEKPLDLKRVCHEVRGIAARRSSGFLRGFSLGSFLQLMELERKTCTLSITSEHKRGVLAFRDGHLLAAHHERGTGLDAALEIVSWDPVSIALLDQEPAEGEPLVAGTQVLLMEGMRRRDEAKRPRPSHTSATKEAPHMNLEALKDALSALQEDLGDGLVAVDVYSVANSQPLAGIHSNPKFCALFNQISEMINKALKAGGAPPLRKHYLLDLEEDHLILVSLHGAYQMGLLVNSHKVQLGMLLNVIMPAFSARLAEAMGG